MPSIAITEELHQVGGSGLTWPEDAAIYLIRFGEGAALIDAGCGRSTERLLANIADTGTALETIGSLLLTHCHFDHAGGAAVLRERLRCRVVAHARDAVFIETGDGQVTAADWYGARMTPCPVDVKLAGEKETIWIGDRPITALAIPGHSPGSVAYLAQSGGQKIIFAQDVHGPLHPMLLSDRGDYLASLHRLLDENADILCEGHYGIFHDRDSIGAFIRRFLA
jgi:glyoxylase-like metal-dependent hydrolase (beta-lactamase superfamily II)